MKKHRQQEDAHALIGAYALDALTDGERRAFAAHLEGCADCARELAGFAATTARLAAAVSVPAPPDLKLSVMRDIDSVRQLAPHTGADRADRLGWPDLRDVRDLTRRRAGPFPLLPRRVGPFVVAASIAAAAAFGALAVWQHQEARTQVQHAEAQVREASAVLAAADARTVHGRTSGGATASVVTSARLNKSVFVASGLPPAPVGKTYQLWFDDHGTMRPAGLVHQDGTRLMQGDPGRALAVGLTLEPEGGSPRPTSSPLILLSLPA
ncbi:anti-sigma factor [Streptomyces sp. ISL-66]|uniref:anti-sigma factor n=1 Tax=Streptomyces sp. ISL-66 TaxID=2819186 RepID=UPI001BECD2AF|nr:anti-sigma factor [Streptomyces sp. ISL-66]MBT2467701.1 anti-sigma factor [Streptomyces sp. ISL-66]